MKKINKKKFKIDEELDALMDEASSIKGSSETINTTVVAKNNNSIKFEIKDKDDEFLVKTKELVNESDISLQDIYNKRGQCDGYNMVYSIREKNQLGKDRILDWCDILHKVPILTFRDMTESEIKEAEERLLSVKNKKKTKKKK